jgi:hypothetical protein
VEDVDHLGDLLEVRLVRRQLLAVDPAPVPGLERPVGAVRVEDVEEDEERLLVVAVEPVEEAADVGAGRLAGWSCGP